MSPRATLARLGGLAGRAWEGWQRFWFDPCETSTLAVVRIVYGAIIFFWTLSQLPTLLTFYGSNGILPNAPDLGPGAWTVLAPLSGDVFVIGLFALMLVAAIALTIGFFPRAAAVLLFIGTASLQRRHPYVHNAGDALLRIMPLYLALSPCGEALSFDRWRKQGKRFWEFPARSQVALRLMQIQVSIVYLDSVWDKVRGVSWNDGTAVSYALRIGDLQRLPVPGVFGSSELIANFLTWGTLAMEFALAVLVWNRAARPWVLLAGASLHLGIDWAMRVGFFSFGILVFYLAFLPPDKVSSALLSAREAVLRRGRPADATLSS